MQASLLIELLTEELPPKSLLKLSQAFCKGIFEGLKEQGFVAADADYSKLATEFATPRRLAVLIKDVLTKQPERMTERKGPALASAYDQNEKPTPALTGFAKSCGVEISALQEQSDKKGEYFVFRTQQPGEALEKHLSEIIAGVIKKLPVAKLMRWGESDVEFVRPVHGLMMVHGNKVVPGRVLGLQSRNTTSGHRFPGKDEIDITSADDYETLLENEGKVIASFEKRRNSIKAQLQQAADGAKPIDDADLLDEVTALVEYPVVLTGTFNQEFLSVPQECLILTMKRHQRYFPLFDTGGKLLPKFLLVSNQKADHPQHIIQGNERVLRARLSDAKFFFEQDKKSRLEERVPKLANVVYHNKLGSQLERVERIQLLAGKIARDLSADPVLAERAAWLAKADLLTGMVGEFPELQGVMGRYYALHDGEQQAVADAIESHYRPRFAGDVLPEEPIVCAVALADKLDILVGIFGIGLIPTGDRDPFALRRHALGLLRILSELKLDLNLDDLLKEACGNFPSGILLESHQRGDVYVPNYMEVTFFVKERAKSYLRGMGYSALEVEAVLDLNPPPAEYVDRLEAVRSFLSLPEAIGLAEADKRIRNILSKSGGDSVVQMTDESKLKVDEERQLLRIARLLRKQVDALIKDKKFSEALLLTAQVHNPVTVFFDKVMVNVEDKVTRLNRFALLHEVGNLTNQVVNISKLAA